MQGFLASRRRRLDLLARPPCGAATYQHGLAASLVDPTEQLAALADLVDRGLLSREEFEQQKARVLEP